MKTTRAAAASSRSTVTAPASGLGVAADRRSTTTLRTWVTCDGSSCSGPETSQKRACSVATVRTDGSWLSCDVDLL